MGRRGKLTCPDLPPSTRCDSCGHRNDEHNYRHPFVTSMPRMDPQDRIAALESERDAAESVAAVYDQSLQDIRTALGL